MVMVSTAAKTAMWDSVDVAIVLLLVGSTFYCAYRILHYLYWDDETMKRASQCPPHEWGSQYRDATEAEKEVQPTLTAVYVGLRCGKCKRTPNNLYTGSWIDIGPWGAA